LRRFLSWAGPRPSPGYKPGIRKIIHAAAAAKQLTKQNPPQTPPAPKQLVVISVDQFSPKLFEEYRPQFTGGLARLASGTALVNGYQSHAGTETCPGHSTILTGDHPARTGIAINSWHDERIARADKDVYCAEDETVPGSTSTNYTVSPVHLRVPTLGDIMKGRMPGSRGSSAQ
jgi:predicted AlkP superfamily pyrophosphatase or phosphodiesterase